MARVIDRADWHLMEQFVRTVCGDKVSLLATDEHHAYAHLGDDAAYQHGHVKHSAKQYVVGGDPHEHD